MSYQLALTRADVTSPDGTVTASVPVSVRANVLRVGRQGRLGYVEHPGVLTVTSTSRRTWSVATPDGEFTVRRVGGCGCGR